MQHRKRRPCGRHRAATTTGWNTIRIIGALLTKLTWSSTIAPSLSGALPDAFSCWSAWH